MCGSVRVKHSTFWFTIASFLLAVYSPPGRPLEKLGLGLVSVSPSVSVALVSTLATVSVHFCLCPFGLHTCHNVSPLLSLSRWSPHLPQCQSTSVSVALFSTLDAVSVQSVLKCLSHCPCGYTDGTTEWKHSQCLHRRHSQNSCSYLLPLTGAEPESSGEHVSPVTTTSSRPRCPNWMRPCKCCFLPQLGLPVSWGGGGGDGRGHVASLWLVD